MKFTEHKLEQSFLEISMTNSEIILYKNSEGNIKIDVRLEDETVWLTQAQICELFQKSKATVSEHIKNIFEEGELEENSVVRNFRTTASDGKTTIPISTISM